MSSTFYNFKRVLKCLSETLFAYNNNDVELSSCSTCKRQSVAFPFRGIYIYPGIIHHSYQSCFQQLKALQFYKQLEVSIVRCFTQPLLNRAIQCDAITIVNVSYFCRLGGHYRNSNIGTEQVMEVERIINHHSYKQPNGMAHDISMLKLRRPAQINRAVNLACLPGSNGEVSDGKMCWVTGN